MGPRQAGVQTGVPSGALWVEPRGLQDRAARPLPVEGGEASAIGPGFSEDKAFVCPWAVGPGKGVPGGGVAQPRPLARPARWGAEPARRPFTRRDESFAVPGVGEDEPVIIFKFAIIDLGKSYCDKNELIIKFISEINSAALRQPAGDAGAAGGRASPPPSPAPRPPRALAGHGARPPPAPLLRGSRAGPGLRGLSPSWGGPPNPRPRCRPRLKAASRGRDRSRRNLSHVLGIKTPCPQIAEGARVRARNPPKHLSLDSLPQPSQPPPLLRSPLASPPVASPAPVPEAPLDPEVAEARALPAAAPRGSGSAAPASADAAFYGTSPG